MAGPASPNEGPTFEPPHLPPGWIAQWDGASKKYYFVQLSTGVSQWEVPTDAAPGGTPAQQSEHPYGVPGPREVITHPDGTQTLKHPDGRMEPILPPDSSRGIDGQMSDRGFGVRWFSFVFVGLYWDTCPSFASGTNYFADIEHGRKCPIEPIVWRSCKATW